MKYFIVFILLLITDQLLSNGNCKIELKANNYTPITINDGCLLKGILYKVDEYYKGQYQLDMRSLKTGISDFDDLIYDSFYNRNRFTSLDLYPFYENDKKIKLWIKLNGIVDAIDADVLEKTNEGLKFRVFIGLDDFKLHRKEPWRLFDNIAVITAQVSINAP